MADFPKAPNNINVATSYHVGAVDIHWDDPKLVPENGEFKLLGVNVWRSNTAPDAEYEKLTLYPIGSRSFRDLTEDVQIVSEDVTQQFVSRGDDERKSWVFQVRNRPIIKHESQFEFATLNNDIIVEVYNPDTQAMEEVPVAAIRGDLGTVELIKTAWFDPVTQKNIPALLPDFTDPNTKVTCTYWWGRRLFTLGLLERTYYKVTTVGQKQDGTIVESKLEDQEAKSPYQQETLDYIWKEAIRRNRWILDQGADRALVFLKKWLGSRCRCYNPDRGRAKHECEFCYGTGYEGGYEGPFEILVAPPEAEKSFNFEEGGLKYEFDYSSWTMDSPLLREWDIICKRDGTRYVVSGVNQQGQRDRIFQQHFSLSLLSENDIAYKIPVNPESRRTGPIPEVWDGHGEKPSADSAQIEDDRKAPPTQKKGRTIIFENLQ